MFGVFLIHHQSLSILCVSGKNLILLNLINRYVTVTSQLFLKSVTLSSKFLISTNQGFPNSIHGWGWENLLGGILFSGGGNQRMIEFTI